MFASLHLRPPQVCSADDRNVKWRKELAQRLGCIARYCKAVSVASEFLKFHLQTHMDSNHLDLVDPDFLFVLDLFWLKKPSPCIRKYSYFPRDVTDSAAWLSQYRRVAMAFPS